MSDVCSCVHVRCLPLSHQPPVSYGGMGSVIGLCKKHDSPTLAVQFGNRIALSLVFLISLPHIVAQKIALSTCPQVSIANSLAHIFWRHELIIIK